MQRLAKHKTNGFTLIEILIVMLIMGIVISFAMLASGDFGQSTKLYNSGVLFKQRLDSARTLAILQTQPIGIEFSGHKYQFMRYSTGPDSAQQHWSPINNAMARSGYFSKHSQVDVKPSSALSSSTASVRMPQVIISSAGEISPFQLSLSNKNGHIVSVISVQSDGQLSIRKNLNNA